MTAERLVGYQYPPKDTVIAELKELCGDSVCSVWLLMKAYTYGVIQGKRAERARRKKAAIGAGTPTTAIDTMQDRQSVKCEYNTAARDMEGVNE